MVKFIRRAGRIIPIREKKIASALNRAVSDKSHTSRFVSSMKKRDLSHTEKEALQTMSLKADKKLLRLSNLKSKNESYAKKLKKVGASAAAGIAALTGIKLVKDKK